MDTAGAPVAGAVVVATWAGQLGLDSSSPPQEHNIITDRDGHFALRDLPAGEYFVLAASDGHPTGSAGPVTVSDATMSLRIVLDRSAHVLI